MRPLADRNPERIDYLFRVADRETVVKFLGRLIQEQNREYLVRDEPLRQLCDLVQQEVQIQDRGDLMVDLDEVGQETRVSETQLGILAHDGALSRMFALELEPRRDAPASRRARACV